MQKDAWIERCIAYMAQDIGKYYKPKGIAVSHHESLFINVTRLLLQQAATPKWKGSSSEEILKARRKSLIRMAQSQ